MSILVIGGSGFIGSRVTSLLNRNGIEVISFDIVRSNFSSENIKIFIGDILNLSSIRRLLFEYDISSIIHLVGLPSIGYCEKNPYFSFELNVLSVQNTLEAMRLADIRKIVFASSAAVYGYQTKTLVKESDPVMPNTIYGYHKLIGEELIKSYSNSYGLNYIILRLFNVYGGNPQVGKDVISIFIRKALKGEHIIIYGPNKFRDFVHVDDVANMFMKAVKTDVNNITVNVGTGKIVTLRRIAEIMKRVFPKLKVKYEYPKDDGTGIAADITVARRLFGFSPMDPERSIYNYVASYAHNFHNKQ